MGGMGYLQRAAACFTVTPPMMVLYAGLAACIRGFLSVQAGRRINKGAAVVMAGVGVVVSG